MKKKIAICLRGFVSNNIQSLDFYNNTSGHVKFSSVYKSLFIHIIQCNPTYEFDFFLQSWS